MNDSKFLTKSMGRLKAEGRGQMIEGGSLKTHPRSLAGGDP